MDLDGSNEGNEGHRKADAKTKKYRSRCECPRHRHCSVRREEGCHRHEHDPCEQIAD